MNTDRVETKIIKDYSYKELQIIKKNIAKLDKTEQLEILKTIKFYNVSYPMLIVPFISKASEILGRSGVEL